MGKNGGCDFRDWETLRGRLKGTDDQLSVFINSCAKELAARLLAKVIKRTKPGDYPKSTGKKGGTLRRGWTAGKEQDATAYSQGLRVNRVGDNYVIEIVNPTEYASYVEFGHRTRNHKGWVAGKLIMTSAVSEIEAAAPAILERKVKKALEDCFK